VVEDVVCRACDRALEGWLSDNVVLDELLNVVTENRVLGEGSKGFVTVVNIVVTAGKELAPSTVILKSISAIYLSISPIKALRTNEDPEVQMSVLAGISQTTNRVEYHKDISVGSQSLASEICNSEGDRNDASRLIK